jgi:hypothetical protein
VKEKVGKMTREIIELKSGQKIHKFSGLISEYKFKFLKYYNKVRTYSSKFSATKLKISNPNLI